MMNFFTFFSFCASVCVVFCILFYILLGAFLLPNVAFDILCCSTESCGNLCMLSIYVRLFRVCHRKSKEQNRMWWWWWWFRSYLYYCSQLRPCLQPPFWTIPFLHKCGDALLDVSPNCFSDMLSCSTTHCGIYNG